MSRPDGGHQIDPRMKREQGPATPEEALKTLPMTDGQRDMLTIGLYQIRNETPGKYQGLARASSNLKQRMLALKLARTALANLTKALRTPFKNDLLEAMGEAWDGALF